MHVSRLMPSTVQHSSPAAHAYHAVLDGTFCRSQTCPAKLQTSTLTEAIAARMFPLPACEVQISACVDSAQADSLSQKAHARLGMPTMHILHVHAHQPSVGAHDPVIDVEPSLTDVDGKHEAISGQLSPQCSEEFASPEPLCVNQSGTVR